MTLAFLGLSRKFHGHGSLKEYYEKESCVHYIHNVRAELPHLVMFFSWLCLYVYLFVCFFDTWACIFQIKVPLLLVNSADDPLVHNSLLAIPRTLAGN